MDNLCHTLVGAALAESGLRRWTRLAVPTLLIGANLPDLDALAYVRDPLFALGFRRGWTHGVLALVVLPVLLTGLMLAAGRLTRGRKKAPPPDARSLLLLSAIAVWSHPFLDLLNTYGVRLLMPFSERWFYADTLFIVDPWLWLLVGGGALWSWVLRRKGRSHAVAERPARLAGIGAMVYIGCMGISAAAARRIVHAEAVAEGLDPIATMVAPGPANPFVRSVVLRTPGGYRRGRFRWLGSPTFTLDPRPVVDELDQPEVEAAAGTPAGSTFLRWSRFPAATVRNGESGPIVRFYDLRYAGPTAGWAAVEVPIERPAR
jgi:inner membrane protein